jgi:hypothetical protein
MLGTMTDQAMALALGDYINGLLERITALEGLFTEYSLVREDGHRVEIPYRDLVKKILHEDAFRRLADGQYDSLRQAIGDGTPESELIRALYRHFVGD